MIYSGRLIFSGKGKNTPDITVEGTANLYCSPPAETAAHVHEQSSTVYIQERGCVIRE